MFKKKITQVTIFISGGVVQAIHSDLEPEQIKIDIVDIDDLKEDGYTNKEINNTIDDVATKLNLIY